MRHRGSGEPADRQGHRLRRSRPPSAPAAPEPEDGDPGPSGWDPADGDGPGSGAWAGPWPDAGGQDDGYGEVRPQDDGYGEVRPYGNRGASGDGGWYGGPPPETGPSGGLAGLARGPERGFPPVQAAAAQPGPAFRADGSGRWDGTWDGAPGGAGPWDGAAGQAQWEEGQWEEGQWDAGQAGQWDAPGEAGEWPGPGSGDWEMPPAPGQWQALHPAAWEAPDAGEWQVPHAGQWETDAEWARSPRPGQAPQAGEPDVDGAGGWEEGPWETAGAWQQAGGSTAKPEAGTKKGEAGTKKGTGKKGTGKKGTGKKTTGKKTGTRKTAARKAGPKKAGPKKAGTKVGTGTPVSGRAPRARGSRTRIVVLAGVAGVLIAALGVTAYTFLADRTGPDAPSAAAPKLPSAQPSAAKPPPGSNLGKWRFITSRATDKSPLQLGQLYPAAFMIDGTSFVRTADRTDKTCSSALFGSALRDAASNNGCTQAMRASYASAGKKMMGTIGVLNLATANGAAKVGRATGADDFVTPLDGSGPTKDMSQGTGVVQAEYKGHYLILIFAEYASLNAPKRSWERNDLEKFASDLIAGSANIDLSNRMVHGHP